MNTFQIKALMLIFEVFTCFEPHGFILISCKTQVCMISLQFSSVSRLADGRGFEISLQLLKMP